MIALVLAAQVAAMPNLLLQDIPARCRSGPTPVAAGRLPEGRLQRLGDLPRPHLEIAVERRISGCPAPVIIRYAVEGDGRATR